LPEGSKVASNSDNKSWRSAGSLLKIKGCQVEEGKQPGQTKISQKRWQRAGDGVK
jgi:hypothetical protein